MIRPVTITLAVLTLLAACSPVAGPLGTPSSVGPSPAGSTRPSAAPSSRASATPRVTATPTATPSGTTIVRAYFVLGSFTGNEGLVPVLREVPQTKAVATAAVRALLEGPNDAEMAGRPAMYTAIPDATSLLGISIAGGVATVNLSQEFASGGDAASLRRREAQVVYTLTQFPTVDAVRFQLDGAPAPAPFDTAANRTALHDQLAAIFVDRPAWGASLGNPGTVSGLANVFEAAFRVELRGASDVVLASRQVTASCGTGCWGSWKTSVPYSVAKAQWGTLRVFDLAAKDGSVEHLTEYPVWLTPAP
jgi:germination protein M